MWKSLVLLSLSIAAFTASAGAPDRCQPVDGRFEITGPDISLEEMERIGLERARARPQAPQVPWTYGNKDWLTFKSAHRPADRIRPYALAFKLGEKPFTWGYALFRGECLLLAFPVRVA